VTSPRHRYETVATLTQVPLGGHGREISAELLPARMYVVRHGRSVLNRNKRVSGQLDPALANEGRMQARHLERVLQNEDLTAIYTSALGRTVETARPTAESFGLEIQTRYALNEQHMGILQGRYRDRRDPEAQRLWRERKIGPPEHRILGGESFLDVQARVAACVADILRREAGGVVLIVGHRNTNRAILAVLLGWPVSYARWLPLKDKFLYEVIPGKDPGIRTISLRDGTLGLTHEGFRS
jgi:broad specificity phosphatase PhoE